MNRNMFFQNSQSNKGFATILAVLLTGFLIVLSMGVLFLYLSESKINRTLFSSTVAYHAAEWAMEYALLKIKNHREGFSDALDFSSDDAKILDASFGLAPKMQYHIETNQIGSPAVYSGSIAAKWFEIIPLFFEEGSTLTNTWKDPKVPTTPPFSVYKQASDISVVLTGALTDQIVWNVIANDQSGDSYGLAGSFSWGIRTLDVNTMGIIKTLSSWVLSSNPETLGSFLNTSRTPSLREPYLVLFNTSEATSVSYEIRAMQGFTLPTFHVIASGRVGNITANLRFSESKNRLFEMLKYSVFVPN